MQSAAPTVVRKPVVGKSRLAELSLLADTGGRYTTDLSGIMKQPILESKKEKAINTKEQGNWVKNE